MWLWSPEWPICQCRNRLVKYINSIPPLDSITLLSPIFRACDTGCWFKAKLCHFLTDGLTEIWNYMIYMAKTMAMSCKSKRIPQPTSNTLFMPMVIVFGSTSESGVMFSGYLSGRTSNCPLLWCRYRLFQSRANRIEQTLLYYPLIIKACSSIKLPSPITIGPASAMIRALGCTTVRAPEKKNKNKSKNRSL